MKPALIVSLFLLVLTSFQEKNTTIFLIADSTVADKPYGDGNPEKGWGQVFPLYFDNSIQVDNHAVNGRSTKSFIDEGRWELVLEKLAAGDYVFIEFGHNDQKIQDPNRYADPDTAYRANLVRFISESREKGAIPILCTPIVRRSFDESGRLIETHGRYPDVVREVAESENVMLIDLQKKTKELLSTYGEERSKQLFLHIEPGEYPSIPDGEEDNTHLSAVGAFRICDLVVADLRKEVPELANHLKK